MFLVLLAAVCLCAQAASTSVHLWLNTPVTALTDTACTTLGDQIQTAVAEASMDFGRPPTAAEMSAAKGGVGAVSVQCGTAVAINTTTSSVTSTLTDAAAEAVVVLAGFNTPTGLSAAGVIGASLRSPGQPQPVDRTYSVAVIAAVGLGAFVVAAAVAAIVVRQRAARAARTVGFAELAKMEEELMDPKGR